MADSFESLWESLSQHPFPTRWQPAADVYQLQRGWLIKIELAGVRKEEFDLRVAGNQLIVSGRRRDWQMIEKGQCQSLEITYDEFKRSFDFPVDISQADIDVNYADGMLIVKVTP